MGELARVGARDRRAGDLGERTVRTQPIAVLTGKRSVPITARKGGEKRC